MEFHARKRSSISDAFSQREPDSTSLENALPQISAKALDALAGVFEIGGLGGVGNPERRSETERRTLHDGDTFVFQELGDEILVVADHPAGRRGLANGAGAGRVDIERAFGPRAYDAVGLIEHRHREVATLLEHLVVGRDEVLRTVER